MTCFFRDSKGIITPAVCIVISAVVLLNFAFIDYLKISSLSAGTKGIQMLGAQSALSMYYRTLGEKYGLYALYSGDVKAAEMCFYDSVSSFSSSADRDASLLFNNMKSFPELRLMEHSVSSFSVKPLGKLSDIEVFRTQICKIMKYKTPAGLAKKLASMIKEFTGLASLTGIYGKYAEATMLYDDYKASLAELYSAVGGVSEFDINCVNGITRLPICNDSTFVRTIRANNILPEGSVYNEEQAALLKNGLSAYSFPAGLLYEQNIRAEEMCVKLLDIISDQDNKLSDIDEWLDDFEPEDDYEEAFADSIEEMIDEMRESYVRVYLPSLRDKLSINKDIMNEAHLTWSKLDAKINAGCTVSRREINDVLDSLSDAYESYVTIELPEKEAGIGKEDAKKYEKYLLGEDFGNIEDGLSQETAIADEIYSTLPSVKYCSEMFVPIQNLESVKGAFGSAKDIVALMNSCTSIGELIGKEFNDTIESVYINDYIISYMNCVSDDGDDIGRYMKGEIEYIITGEKEESVNTANVYAKLIELRAGFNTVHILSDTEKYNTAKKAGKALASLTGEMGAMAYTAMIVGSWAFAESIVDVTALERGETVPLIKKKGDWKTSVDGLTFGSAYMLGKEASFGDKSEEITDSDNILAMDYKDYLAVLLFQIPEELKLYRIQDVIELNLYKESNSRLCLDEFYTEICCTAEYITETFVYSDNGKKRYCVNEVIYAAL